MSRWSSLSQGVRAVVFEGRFVPHTGLAPSLCAPSGSTFLRSTEGAALDSTVVPEFWHTG